MTRLAVVTGAAGFIGGRVAARLVQEGWRVIGIGHGSPPPESGLKRRWVESDVSATALSKLGCAPDAIIHCAGTASVGRAESDPRGEQLRTVGATRAVLDFSASLPAPARMVMVSSAAVYGAATLMPTPENAPLGPLSRYGEFKAEAEGLWREHASRYGQSMAIVRLFSVYGEGLRKQLLWDACGKLLRGDGRFDGTGDETRDWLHVDDAANLLVSAIGQASRDCAIVNGGSGSAVRVRDVLEVLRVALGDLPLPRYSGVARSGDPQHYAADISLALSWGWRPGISWREGVERYAHWFTTLGEAAR
ncbi:MAG: NAD-dependent epimerase/dehydratase family protein [Burkholderiales bacterium]